MNISLLLYPFGYNKAMKELAEFVKDKRKGANLTQEDLAKKAGVGLRFLRDLEQGKQSLMTDKVDQILKMFGYTLGPVAMKRETEL